MIMFLSCNIVTIVVWLYSAQLSVVLAYKPIGAGHFSLLAPVHYRQQPTPPPLPVATTAERNNMFMINQSFSRRALVSSSLSVVTGLATAIMLKHDSAAASGGATAGGPYLLSAKQRYNERVQKGAMGFNGLRASLEKGNIEVVREFFAGEEIGFWKDFSAAGFLLANAFRRNSTASPESLPAVKKWKAFTAQVEAMTKSLKKKDNKGALQSYLDAVVALDEYLDEVELPSAKA